MARSRLAPRITKLGLIACAVAAKATHIVSGDNDLLILKGFRGIAILSPADAMRVIEPT